MAGGLAWLLLQRDIGGWMSRGLDEPGTGRNALVNERRNVSVQGLGRTLCARWLLADTAGQFRLESGTRSRRVWAPLLQSTDPT